jgi:hypothetical protein
MKEETLVFVREFQQSTDPTVWEGRWETPIYWVVAGNATGGWGFRLFSALHQMGFGSILLVVVGEALMVNGDRSTSSVQALVGTFKLAGRTDHSRPARDPAMPMLIAGEAKLRDK